MYEPGQFVDGFEYVHSFATRDTYNVWLVNGTEVAVRSNSVIGPGFEYNEPHPDDCRWWRTPTRKSEYACRHGWLSRDATAGGGCTTKQGRGEGDPCGWNPSIWPDITEEQVAAATEGLLHLYRNVKEGSEQ